MNDILGAAARFPNLAVLSQQFYFFHEEGSGRGRDKGQEKGLFQKITPIKSIQLSNNLEKFIFLKKYTLNEIYASNLMFYRKPKWSVRSIRTTFMRY